MTDFNQALDFLYNSLPVFQHKGAGAYKPGLETATRLSRAFGNPHSRYKTIHVAGTNGKGSVSHSLAAILQSAGYKVGLYTSPHLVDFRERIRVNGKMISKSAVVDFVNRYRAGDFGLDPSFFELTMVMAFEYFAREAVDVAVIEVGLGGRLDSTNIIRPELSIITNISKDHTAFLGDTLELIAAEKAGIIKSGIPVVVGEASGGVKKVFEDKARQEGTTIVFAEEYNPIVSYGRHSDGLCFVTSGHGELTGQLSGDCQVMNMATILTAVDSLQQLGFDITDDAIARGVGAVCELTGLMGRWMKISDAPLTICDTGHNEGGWQYIARQLASYNGHKHVIIGFVSDKDISSILPMLSGIEDVTFYFTRPSVERAMPAETLARKAADFGLKGDVSDTVSDAYKKALGNAKGNDMIFVGGSTFVVADFLAEWFSGQR